MVDFSFNPLAQREYFETLEDYKQISLRVAEGFEQEFDTAIHSVRRFPLGYPAIDAAHRIVILNRYPYGIVYRPFPNRIRVIAVIHTRRRPGYWKGRV